MTYDDNIIYKTIFLLDYVDFNKAISFLLNTSYILNANNQSFITKIRSKHYIHFVFFVISD